MTAVTTEATTGQLVKVRAWLADIPNLADTAANYLTPGTPREDSPSRSVPSSRPPLDVGILDLLDGRHLWPWVELVAAARDFQPGMRGPRNACRILRTQAPWLAENLPATWADFVTELGAIHWRYRLAARETPGPQLTCPDCGHPAFIDGLWMVCREVETHTRTVKSIENELRFDRATPTVVIVSRFDVTEDRLYQWRRRGKLKPARQEGRVLYWWPWDVFCLLNPDVAEAIAMRDGN